MSIGYKPKAAWLPLTLIISTAALAQAPPAGPAPFYDPAQLPSFTGKVQQFTLTRRGEIDGLILVDGTEVKTPPHLSTAVAYAVKPGDSVTIHGLRAAAVALIQATSITDHTSGRSIVDNGPEGPPGAPGPGAAATGMLEVHGPIRMDLHGARGEVNGALLADGTVLRLPPDAAINLSSVLQPGRTVVAQGNQLSSPIGRVLEVRAIGSSRADMTPVDPPGPLGPPGPRGRLPGPLPDAPPSPGAPPPPGAG